MIQPKSFSLPTAIEDAGDTFNNAPNDVLDEAGYEQYAYAFFGHAEEPQPADARWLSGPSLDGKGEFSFVDPPKSLSLSKSSGFVTRQHIDFSRDAEKMSIAISNGAKQRPKQLRTKIGGL